MIIGSTKVPVLELERHLRRFRVVPSSSILHTKRRHRGDLRSPITSPPSTIYKTRGANLKFGCSRGENLDWGKDSKEDTSVGEGLGDWWDSM